jgi:hypothetical protein
LKTIIEQVRSWREARRARRATLPWHELEAEARRQGCGPVDIFFDRAGHGARVGGERR